MNFYGQIIKASSSVKNLCVILDRDLGMEDQKSLISEQCFLPTLFFWTYSKMPARQNRHKSKVHKPNIEFYFNFSSGRKDVASTLEVLFV